ncbi:hypothetical protein ABZT47_09650 [Sphaerisporangium sp. NPDC005289]|uniref:WD40 repeat domain-containing protein n=1 Tax=Sphaerisporangium sp. NPDC005289 TaxID=3155247 RepID=UPI0033A2D110
MDPAEPVTSTLTSQVLAAGPPRLVVLGDVWFDDQDAATGTSRALMREHHAVVGAVAVAPDGSWLASAGWNGTVRIWDTATWQQSAILTGHRPSITKRTHSVRGIAAAPDGTWLASAGSDGTTRVWDTATWRQHLKLTDPAVTTLAVAPDGHTLATAGHTGEIRLWDPSTGRPHAMMRVDGGVRARTWSPTGDRLVVGGAAGLYRFTITP